MEEIPVFGRRVEGCPYVVRPSAYALVRNERGEVAVVRTARGCFLPGGGIGAGESPEQTVEREAREECGLLLRPRAVLGHAVDIVHAAAENTCFEKRSAFVGADAVGVVPEGEAGHVLLWLQPDRAVEALAHAGHRWAVRALARHGERR